MCLDRLEGHFYLEEKDAKRGYQCFLKHEGTGQLFAFYQKFEVKTNVVEKASENLILDRNSPRGLHFTYNAGFHIFATKRSAKKLFKRYMEIKTPPFNLVIRPVIYYGNITKGRQTIWMAKIHRALVYVAEYRKILDEEVS